ncbi:MAG: hypothetical protein LKE54_04355 [Prevotella sp.]|nr:hypothetical protein [Prevotella sp.]MCH3994274.1 hypothetical protein [Prevotella sp.]
MSIIENKVLFGNVDRFEVKKIIADFEDCRLYIDNRLIISGKGTVTSITNDQVKVQIVGGKSRIKFNSRFEKHYIDQISFPDVVIDSGLQDGFYSDGTLKNIISEGINMGGNGFKDMLFISFSKDCFIGQKGVCAFNPVFDETNEIIANCINVAPFDKCVVNGVNHKGTWPFMYNIAVQPNLLYVVKKVLEYEGYRLVKNDYDKDPWNRLLIASATKTIKIENSLPHWTVYKFIEEIRKLFNASFIFDEIEKTVKIISANELLTNKSIGYEAVDDFSVEYDSDGLENLATSNVEYSFDGSVNRDWREVITPDVFKKFTTKVYDSEDQMTTAAAGMSDEDRRKTIFQVGNNYYIWAMMSKNGDPDSEDQSEQKIQCGFFSPIVRDNSSEDYMDLNICPAAFSNFYKHNQKEPGWMTALDLMGKETKVMIPSVSNDKEAEFENMSEDENGNYYMSVQDAMENGLDQETDGTEDDSKIPVMFQSDYLVYNINNSDMITKPGEKFGNYDLKNCWPITYTDHRMFNWAFRDKGSLTLANLPYQEGIGSYQRDYKIDKHNQITIKFITDDVPTPSKIYDFRNKKYICEKIEMEISNGSIEREKTGYFYEVL